MLQDSPRGIRPLQSLNPGHCKTSTATASHTSATLKKKKKERNLMLYMKTRVVPLNLTQAELIKC